MPSVRRSVAVLHSGPEHRPTPPDVAHRQLPSEDHAVPPGFPAGRPQRPPRRPSTSADRTLLYGAVMAEPRSASRPPAGRQHGPPPVLRVASAVARRSGRSLRARSAFPLVRQVRRIPGTTRSSRGWAGSWRRKAPRRPTLPGTLGRGTSPDWVRGEVLEAWSSVFFLSGGQLRGRKSEQSEDQRCCPLGNVVCRWRVQFRVHRARRTDLLRFPGQAWPTGVVLQPPVTGVTKAVCRSRPSPPRTTCTVTRREILQPFRRHGTELGPFAPAPSVSG
ncbi:hypothetical protein J2X68_007951 [Streptomyces sp. 3330]|nr:hypothetical protein [Streptomyces sp. 3330]